MGWNFGVEDLGRYCLRLGCCVPFVLKDWLVRLTGLVSIHDVGALP